MVAAYVNKGTFDSGNGAITPGIPSGYTVGNLLLLLVESANEVISIPSGWNMTFSQQGTGTSAAAGGVRLAVMWRIATAGQTAPTIPDTGNHTTGIIFEFSGVDPDSPFYSIGMDAMATPNTTIPLPAAQCTKANQLVVMCVANDRDAAGTANLSNWTNPDLNTLVERHDQTVSTGVGGGIGMATGLSNAAGMVGAGSVTNVASVTAAMVTLSLRDPGSIYGTITNTSSHTASMRGKARMSTTTYSGLPYSKTIKYGALYNYHAVSDARNIANTGWHMPVFDELYALATYVGTSVIAKLKETGYTYWNSPNTGATNEYGFNARGSGYRDHDNNFYGLTTTGYIAANEIGDGRSVGGSFLTTGKFIGIFLMYNAANMGIANGGELTEGYAVRLRKDSTSLANGQSGTYIGNDGFIYRTICINGVEWLADNLVETKYRNGDSIPIVTGNSEWGALTTGASCYHSNDINKCFTIEYLEPVTGTLRSLSKLSAVMGSGAMFATIKSIAYGAYYNNYAAVDSRNIANTGWHLPSLSEYQALATYLGGSTVAGGKLKETGTVYWLSPNTAATNEFGFNLRGASSRTDSGVFIGFRSTTSLWTSTPYTESSGTCMNAGYDRADFYYSGGGTMSEVGISIRLRKDSTSLSNGQSGTYTGNDGTIYQTICINGVEWLADNLAETKYRNGDWITGFDGGVYSPISNSSWAALTTEAMCYPGDTVSNSYFYADESCVATLKMHSSTAALVSTILAQSGITAALTGTARLQGNADGSTTLFAEIYNATGTTFIPVITFF